MSKDVYILEKIQEGTEIINPHWTHVFGTIDEVLAFMDDKRQFLLSATQGTSKGDYIRIRKIAR